MPELPETTVDLASQSSFQTAPDIDLTDKFSPKFITFRISDDSDAGSSFAVSFDGSTIAQTVTQGKASNPVTWPGAQRQKIWLKKVSGTVIKACVNAG